jgi:endonuclease G
MKFLTRTSPNTNRVLHYITDTDAGSSGSPVFDAGGQLIAVYHAGGRPESVLGRLPLRKNEGVRISQIASDLTARRVGFA